MRVKRHIIWFPFLLIAVTVILGVTIVLVDQNRRRVVVSLEEDGQTVVRDIALTGPSVEDYREELTEMLAPVFEIAQEGSGSVAVVGEARLALLEMRVPSSERDVHIATLAFLNVLERGLTQEDDLLLAEAQLRARELQTTYVWITNNQEVI